MPEPDLRQLLKLIDAALSIVRQSNLETLSVPEIKAHLALLDARRQLVDYLQRTSAVCGLWLRAPDPGPTDSPLAG